MDSHHNNQWRIRKLCQKLDDASFIVQYINNHRSLGPGLATLTEAVLNVEEDYEQSATLDLDQTVIDLDLAQTVTRVPSILSEPSPPPEPGNSTEDSSEPLCRCGEDFQMCSTCLTRALC